MRTKYLLNPVNAALLVTALCCGVNVRAVTSPAVHPVSGMNSGRSQLETVDEGVEFRNRPEAKMLTHLYSILATGDHDYAGHRVVAMHLVERAGKLLGVDLAGDLKDHEKQGLSDDKMRQAQHLINDLIHTAILKDQSQVVFLLKGASKQIDFALATK